MTDYSLLNRIPDRVLKKDYLSGEVSCPFCNAEYISNKEYRSLVKCPICKGRGRLAAKAYRKVDSWLDNAHVMPLEQLKEIIYKIGVGYARSEFRTCYRERIAKESKNE